MPDKLQSNDHGTLKDSIPMHESGLHNGRWKKKQRSHKLHALSMRAVGRLQMKPPNQDRSRATIASKCREEVYECRSPSRCNAGMFNARKRQ